VIVVGFMPVARRLNARLSGSVRLHVTYREEQGVLTRLLQACERRQWQLAELSADAPGEPLDAGPGQTGVVLTLSGNRILTAASVLATIDGVTAIRQTDDDPD
jgi:putative Mg2+ transporter-C (MgtC) family protein